MISGLFEAINGSLNEELRLSVITNNLANVNVAGFKKDRLSFANVLRAELAGGENPVSGAETIQEQELYRRKVRITADMSQGTLRHTGNPLDLAISGKGFFKISAPQGVRYTRRGIFTRNTDGMIVTSAGHFLLGKGGPINAADGEVQVDKGGQVFVEGNLVDTLDLVECAKPEHLEKEGDSLFREGAIPVEIGELSAETAVAQGYLEESNVQATEAMVEMLETVRAYESCQKIIRALHDIDSKAINDVGRTR